MGKLYNAYIYFIIAIKILFIIFAVSDTYIIHKGKGKGNKKINPKVSEFISFWRQRLEVIFTLSMALLCIILFSPLFHNKGIYIDGITQFLLFVYGIIVFITADWSLFFKESKVFKRASSVI